MKLKKILLLAFSITLSLSILVGCSKKKQTTYKDGTYDGKSEIHSADVDGVGAGYATCSITITNNTITACEFIMYNTDGTIKDETYGADLNTVNKNKAQKAVLSGKKYAELIVKEGSLDKVNKISGATIMYNEFVEAVTDALTKAEEK